jgi:sugar phosphate isomerase/epimerase
MYPIDEPSANTSLPTSYKGRYPFRLAVPSYVYPAGYEENLVRLGPYVDEIELLLFQSEPADGLPTRRQVRALARQAEALTVTFNVHLPLDIFPGAREAARRRRAAAVVRRIIGLTAPLAPSTYTLHIPYEELRRTEEEVAAWRRRVAETLQRICDLPDLPRGGISIETLSYPVDWVAGLIDRHQLSICLDVGHLIRYGFDLFRVWGRHRHRVSIIHLQGAMGARDHLPLDCLPEATLRRIVSSLRTFSGIVSLELFSFPHLKSSLQTLERLWDEHAHRDTPG